MPVLSLVRTPCLVTSCHRLAKLGTYLDTSKGPATPELNYLCEECEAASTPPYGKPFKLEATPAALPPAETQLSLGLQLTWSELRPPKKAAR